MSTDHAASTSSRRHFLLAGGAGVLGAATLAACGGPSVVDTSGSAPATSVAATAPPTTPTADAVATARSALRTATSIEQSLADFYDMFTAAAYVDEGAKKWATLFGSHHKANVTALAALTTQSGGKAYRGSNKYVDEQLVAPDLKLANAAKSSDDLITLAAQLETTAASTGTLGVGSVTTGEQRQGLLAAAGTASRQAYLWRLVGKPGDLADALPDAQLSLRDALPASASVDPTSGS